MRREAVFCADWAAFRVLAMLATVARTSVRVLRCRARCRPGDINQGDLRRAMGKWAQWQKRDGPTLAAFRAAQQKPLGKAH